MAANDKVIIIDTRSGLVIVAAPNQIEAINRALDLTGKRQNGGKDEK